MPNWLGAGEGAISGAEAGSFAGPIGTAVGGTIGALSGFFSPTDDQQSKARFDAAMKELTDRYNAEQLNLETIIGKETNRQVARNRQAASRRAMSTGRTGTDVEAMILPGQEKAQETGADTLERGLFGLSENYNQQANQLSSTYAQRPLNPTALDVFMKAAPAVSKSLQNKNLMKLFGTDVSLSSSPGDIFNQNVTKDVNSEASDAFSMGQPEAMDFSGG